MRKGITLLTIPLLLGIILSACGGEDTQNEGTPPPAGIEEALDEGAQPPVYGDFDDGLYESSNAQSPSTGYQIDGNGESSGSQSSTERDYTQNLEIKNLDSEYQDRLSAETYLDIKKNSVKETRVDPALTFSLKVDTAAYNNVARYIQRSNLPPKEAVKTEELLNYFSYETEMAFDGHPFSVYTEIGPSPLDSAKHLAFVRVKAKDLPKTDLPPSNLTFLIDTSGSMKSYDRLPLLKEAFLMLIDQLDENDTVSIVTYAGTAEIVVDSASGEDKRRLRAAINSLEAGGSTAGADGINSAYALAEKNFDQNGNNRIILATDGDFNVGVSSTGALSALVSEKRESGIYLSILGVGMGNIRDDVMETLAKDGNGNHSYINSVADAKKVLIDEMGTNLFTIANDVKAQVEFNPDNITSYRLIGYENRRMSNRDFEDDEKDAGEIGVGADVVILFEVDLSSTERRYAGTPETNLADELFEVRIRYKNPGENQSTLLSHLAKVSDIKTNNSNDFNFASSVAAFAHLLRDSSYSGSATIDSVLVQAEKSIGQDTEGYRKDFCGLVKQTKVLMDTQ